MQAYSEAIDEALGNPDPWGGFCAYIEHVCSTRADDRGFADVLTMTFPTAKEFEEERNRSSNALSDLFDRAKAAGKLRQDFAHQDVPLILMSNTKSGRHSRKEPPTYAESAPDLVSA